MIPSNSKKEVCVDSSQIKGFMHKFIKYCRVDNFFNNIFNFVFLMVFATILKIGLVLQPEITGGDVFQTWVWVVSILFIITLLMKAFWKLEKMYTISGGIVLLTIVTGANYIYTQIGIFILFITMFIPFILDLTEYLQIKRTSKKKPTRKFK